MPLPESFERGNENPEIPPGIQRRLDVLIRERISRIRECYKSNPQPREQEQFEKAYKSFGQAVLRSKGQKIFHAYNEFSARILEEEEKLHIASKILHPSEIFIRIALEARGTFAHIKGRDDNFVYGYDPLSGYCFAKDTRNSRDPKKPQYYRLNIENPHRADRKEREQNKSMDIDENIIWIHMDPLLNNLPERDVLKVLGQKAMVDMALREYVSGWYPHPRDVEGFLNEDPIKDFYPVVYEQWIKPQLPSSQIQNPRLVKRGILLARSLFIRHDKLQPKDVTPQMVKDENTFLEKKRDRFGSIHFFDANVVMVADNEPLTKDMKENMTEDAKKEWGEFRFCNKALWTALKDASSHFRRETPQIIRPGLGEKVSEKVLKEKIHQAIINTPPPLLLFLEMHGFGTGVVIANVLITFAEFAQYFKEREEKWGTDMRREIFDNNNYHFCDRIVAMNCHSSEWLHKFYNSLRKQSNRRAIPPICFAGAERGYYGFTNPKAKYGSDVHDNVLQVGRAREVTLKKIIHADDSRIVDDDSTAETTLIVPLLSEAPSLPYNIAKDIPRKKEQEKAI